MQDITKRNKIIVKYIPFVKYIAHKIHSKLPNNVDIKDIQSIGILGLMDAIERFDPERGISFKSYAETRISGTIYDELRKQDTLPRSVRDRIKLINRAKEELERKLGRAPSDIEISSHIGLDLDKYHKSLQKGNSGKTVYIEDDYNTFANITTKEDVEYLLQNQEISIETAMEEWAIFIFKDVIRHTLSNLSTDKQLVLSLYYDENLSLKEIAKILYISESRVSQIHANSIVKIWENLSKVIKKEKQSKDKQ